MWSIIGHTASLAELKRTLESGLAAHTFAFLGPPGVGKKATAIEFAAALLCEAAERPCGECRSCRDVLAGRHPDVELVAPGGICDEADHRDHSDSRDLRICQIRRLQRLISLSPYVASRRVVIVDAADSLHTESANAFLKTLEEPPGDTVIVLLVEREERLPETVLSRCQRVLFHRLDNEEVRSALSARGAEAEQADEIVAASQGHIGWALRALEDPSLLSERRLSLDNALRVAHSQLAARFAWARQAESRDPHSRERIRRELEVWHGWWRDVLLAASGASEGFINRDRQDELLKEGKLYGTVEVVDFLRSLLRTQELLETNVDAQLALENLTLDMPAPRVAQRVS